MTREMRIKVFNKYNGHCAYCGCEIDYKDMQVDHLIPQWRKNRGMPVNEIECCENYMPSCKKCNHYKRGNSLETFRNQIETIPKKLKRDNYIYNVGVKYHIVNYSEAPKIIFYFERTE